MKIIFPSGITIDVQNANFAVRSNFGYTDIYDKQGGEWLAQVPNDCLILVKDVPGYFMNTIPDMSAEKAITYLTESKHLMEAPEYKVAKLKHLLIDFNGTKREWKNKI